MLLSCLLQFRLLYLFCTIGHAHAGLLQACSACALFTMCVERLRPSCIHGSVMRCGVFCIIARCYHSGSDYITSSCHAFRLIHFPSCISRVPCPLHVAMSTLEEILLAEQLPEALVKKLVDAGWSKDSFAHVVAKEEELSSIWNELLPDTALNLLQKSQLRSAWSKLRGGPPQAASSTLPAEPASGSWVESFAPKLESSKINELKTKFLQDYPSEVLQPQNMPSTRLLSLAAQQQKKGDHRWIPWKFRISQDRLEEMAITRPSKQVKLEGLGLSQVLFDDVPSIEISNANMGVSTVAKLMALHDTAVAMVGSCHLARLKSYTGRFIQLLSQRFEADSGLRAPTMLEAQAADQKLWSSIHALVSDKGWSLSDAIYEISEVRGEMSSLLQPRARAIVLQPKGKGKITPLVAPSMQLGKGKNYKGSKGKGQQPPGKGDKGNRIPWVKEIQSGGEMKKLCMQFQLGKCARGKDCAFVHGCAYPKSDGSACGQTHGAVQHASTMH